MYPKIDIARRAQTRRMFRPSNVFRNRFSLLLLIVFLSFSLLFVTRSNHISTPRLSSFRNSGSSFFNTVNLNATRPLRESRIAKATMLYGLPNFIYEAALKSHVQHNKLHGYEMHVLRTPFVKGFQNKLLWLQHLIMTELQKLEGDRVDWIMYIDPPIILLNPQIPLSIFLPPPDSTFDSLSLIATKPDGQTLSTSSFFLRVSQTSLKILIEAMAATKIDPQYDWGTEITSSALSFVVEKEEYRDDVIYQPAHWYNGAVTKHYIVGEGSLFVWFPKELQGWRWKGMNDLLQSLSKSRERFELKIDGTIYATEPHDFWGRVVEAKKVLKQVEERGKNMAVEDLEGKVRRLRDVVALSAWNTEALEKTKSMLKEAVGLE